MQKEKTLFFNTTGLDDAQVDSEISSLRKKDERILYILKHYSNVRGLTYCDIASVPVKSHTQLGQGLYFQIFNTGLDESTCKRALNTFMKLGLIKKSDSTVEGKKGKQVHTWKYIGL